MVSWTLLGTDRVLPAAPALLDVLLRLRALVVSGLPPELRVTPRDGLVLAHVGQLERGFLPLWHDGSAI